MCSLCTVIGKIDHWTDSKDKLSKRHISATFQRERAYQVNLLNSILKVNGISISDWQGTSFVIANGKGASEVIQHISQVWLAIETLTGITYDPLDSIFLNKISINKNV